MKGARRTRISAVRRAIEPYACALRPHDLDCDFYRLGSALTTALFLEEGNYDGHPNRVRNLNDAANLLDEISAKVPTDVGANMATLADLLREESSPPRAKKLP
ncbi:hypothetical protein F4561_005218 [Lipingzhangella halophila]|uniref:Uncharacterized protein n=1 Tax=Lipingzhangella halophila TaxID=1783352 RepID=A0A7W7RLW7_9ACTN|nr:hypothetical protein [Lipingzhangella halophila]MBB4934398.1 hypothetical protein [Lipingzhangella halophila]